jgi:hypothetical protein
MITVTGGELQESEGAGRWRLAKLAAAMAFLALTLAVFIAYGSPAEDFESSIYSSTPIEYWVAVMASVTIGLVLTVGAVRSRALNRRFAFLGPMVLVMANMVVIALPIIRGYFLWNATGDTGLHLSWAQGVLNSGELQAQNFYPVTAIIMTALSSVLDLEMLEVLKLLPLILAVLYFLGLYYFARTLSLTKGGAIMAAVAGFVLINLAYTYVAPNGMANYFLPLALMILSKDIIRQTRSWKVLAIIVAVFIPFFHPLVAMFLVVALVAIAFYSVMSGRKKIAMDRFGQNAFRSLPIAALIFVITIAWISNFSIWDGMIQDVKNIIEGMGTSHLEEAISDIDAADTKGYNVIEYLAKMYATIGLYVMLAMLSLYSVLKRRSIGERADRIFVLFIPLFIVTIAFAFFYFFSLPFSPIRLLTYISLLTLPAIGFLFHRGLGSRSRGLSTVSSLFIVALLLGVFVAGVAVLFPSPYSLEINNQYTEADASGMDWFIDSKDRGINSTGWYYSPWTESYVLSSYEDGRNRSDLNRYQTTSLPDHLGYDVAETFAESYNWSTYIIIKELNRIVYVDVYPQMAEERLIATDLIRLELDPTVDRLYSSGGFVAYYSE